jgi:hypothetical protein
VITIVKVRFNYFLALKNHVFFKFDEDDIINTFMSIRKCRINSSAE